MNFNLRGFRDEPDSAQHWSFEGMLREQLVPKFTGDVDFRPYSGPRHDQRSTSSCVANATAKALEIKRVMAKGPDSHIDLSRLAIYWFARNLMYPKETSRDDGTYISHAFDAMRRFGVPPEAAWPWDENRIYDSPTWSAMRQAYLSKIKNYYKVEATGAKRVDLVLEALRAGNPVVFGTNVDATWYRHRTISDPLRPVTDDERTGRHATALVGFVDGLFLGENSWGPNWGDEGFYRMTPETIASEVSRDFWVPVTEWETYQERQDG